MRIIVMTVLLAIGVWATDVVDYFQASPENKLLCKMGQYSYKEISQKNASIENVRGHLFFKLTHENLYLLKDGCLALDGKKEAIVF